MSVKFPEGFVALKKYPGYFWNLSEKRLYSIKSGLLIPLKLNCGTYRVPGYGAFGPHYQISTQGKRHHILLDKIDSYLAKGEFTIQREFPS